MPLGLTIQLHVATSLLTRLPINHNYTSFHRMGLPITPTLVLD